MVIITIVLLNAFFCFSLISIIDSREQERETW